MQNTLLAIAITIIVAIVAALVGPWVIDWNGYRPRIEAEASRLIGRPVSIQGDLSIRLLPSIQIDARDVAIGDAAGGARIGRLRGELRVAPLLRGDVSLTSLHIRDADITFGAASRIASFVAAEQLIVENARISMVENGGRPRLLAERAMLTGESRGLRGPLRLEGSAVFGERMVPLHLTTALTDSGSLALRLRASDREGGTTLEADGLIAQQGRPRFDGEFVAHGSTGRFPWRLSGPAAATPDAIVMERFEAQVGAGDRVARGTGSLRIGLGTDRDVELVLSARQIDLDRLTEAAPGATPRDVIAALVQGAPVLRNSDRPISVSFDIAGVTLAGALIGDVRGDARSADGGWMLERLTARLPGGGALEAGGTVALAPDLAFRGPLAVQASRPSALMSWLDGQPTPEGTLDDPIRLAASVIAEPGKLVLDDLDMTTAAGTAKGRIVLDVPALGRHALAVELDADAIDLDLLLRVARGTGARLDPATDTRLRLKAGQVRYAGLAARGLDLSLATDGRTFDAERISLTDLAGFSMDMAGRLDGIGGPLVGRLTGNARAATVDSLIALLSRHERTAALAAHMSARAPSLADADLSFTFAAGGRAALGLRVEGRLGEATVSLDAAGAGSLGSVETLTGRLSFGMDAPRADHIYALVAGETAPGATPGVPTKLSVVVEHPSAGVVRVNGSFTAAGTQVQGAGETADGRSTVSASLTSSDLAPLMPLLGIPADLAGRLPSTLELRGTGLGRTWRLDTARGRIGPTTVDAALTGEGLQATGRLRLGTVSADALAALLSGPAWLAETGTGGFPGIAFGEPPFALFGGRVDLAVETIGLGDAPALTGLAAVLERRDARTSLRGLAARMGETRVAGDLSLDRNALRSVVNARLSFDGVPAALGWPGASGRGAVTLDVTGEGANPAALVAGLAGSGRATWPALSVTGADPKALPRVTRQAELAQDVGRPLTDMAFGAALAQALEAQVALGAAASSFTLSGTTARLPETIFDAPGGKVGWSASIDLAEGRLSSNVRVMPERGRDNEPMPAIAVRFQGAIGQAERQLDTDDVSAWLGLRLVDRAALRIQMTESDRLERVRQRAFGRFTMHPPPPVEVPMPMIPPLAPELIAPPVEATPAEAEPPREGAPVPQRRPADPRAQPRPPAQAGSDLPGVVRRALDGNRQPAAPATGAPLSILPPLPPPVEVGPAPGVRR